MYLVDEEVMKFALGTADVKNYAVLNPSMSVIEIDEVSEDFQRHVKMDSFTIIGKVNRHEVYSRDYSSNVVVQVNKELGVLEAYYPYKLQTERDI